MTKLISNRAYVLSGLATLYAVLTLVWDLPNPVAVLGVLAALTLLSGLRNGNSVPEYDGTLTTVDNDPDTGFPHLQLNVLKDPSEFVDRDTLFFKSIDERTKS